MKHLDLWVKYGWVKRDINQAKKLGIKTCYAKYGETKKPIARGKSWADYEIEDVGELVRLKL